MPSDYDDFSATATREVIYLTSRSQSVTASRNPRQPIFCVELKINLTEVELSVALWQNAYIYMTNSSKLLGFFVTAGFAILALVPVSHAQLTFTSSYVTTSLAGRDGAALQTATNAAMTSLAGYFTTNINLHVRVTLEDLNNTGTLGTSLANFSQISGTGPYYATALYNALTSTADSVAAPSITITMNTNTGINWGFGTGAPGSNKYSWQSVVMHEVLHSMGFYDGVGAGGILERPGYTIFDTFSYYGTGSGSQFSSIATGDNAARLAVITSNNMVWKGTNAVAANGGNPVKLYAPAAFESGSTYSHIDPSQPGVGGLLFPQLGANEFYAGPTAVELGIMKDMGWGTSAIPEPSTYAVIFSGAVIGFTAIVRRRQRASAAPGEELSSKT